MPAQILDDDLKDSDLYEIDYAEYYEGARLWKLGLPIRIDRLSQCALCGKLSTRILECGMCRAARYCCQTCQKGAWKPYTDSKGVQQKGHKAECQMFKRAMEETSTMNAILRQFPWGRMKVKGVFQFHMLLASRNLLGDDPALGYWQDNKPYGTRLLEETHLSEEAGWNLPLDEIPTLTFRHRKPPARCPPSSQMQDWTSYYKWRELPMTSPAALLLHLPLSIYRLLHLFGMTPDARTIKRRSSTAIYYINAQIDVDFLPIFGELALLLPDTDIELVVMCSSFPAIFAKAKASSLLSKPYCYEYQAPPECGGSTISIRLIQDRSKEKWSEPSYYTHELNVFIGLDISHGTNNVNTQPFMNRFKTISGKMSIPMAVTTYHRVLLENDDLLKPDAIPGSQIATTNAIDSRSRVALNPFGRPGPNPHPSHWIPWTLNGFTAVVRPYVENHRVS